MKFKEKIVRFWRSIRGRCVYCGGKIKYYSPTIFYCAKCNRKYRGY